MLDLYVICWRNFNICKDSLDSLIETASEPINITVANPNDFLPNSGTEKIREYLRFLVKDGKIKRALLFEDNPFGFALMKSIELFPPTEDLFFLSDGDLVVPKGGDWVGLSKEYHARGHSYTGFNLSTENYREPNWGFNSADENWGLWLCCANTQFFMERHGVFQNSIDSRLCGLAAGWGLGGIKIRELELLHATWSIHYPNDHYEDKEYAEFKRTQGSNWVYNERPENMKFELVQND